MIGTRDNAIYDAIKSGIFDGKRACKVPSRIFLRCLQGGRLHYTVVAGGGIELLGPEDSRGNSTGCGICQSDALAWAAWAAEAVASTATCDCAAAWRRASAASASRAKAALWT